MPRIHLRNPTIEEAEKMARIERERWPVELANSVENIASRIETFPHGQWAATLDDEIVGVIFAQRLTRLFFESTPWSYDALTDHGTFRGSHDLGGEIYQLVDVSVSRAGKGNNLGRRLVDRQVEFARGLDGVKRILGFTRPVKFHEHDEVSMDEYVQLRGDDGKQIDPVLSFHLDNGASLVQPVERYRPDDPDTCGYAVLIEYPF